MHWSVARNMWMTWKFQGISIWSLDTWIEITKVVASDAAGTCKDPGVDSHWGIECQNPHRVPLRPPESSDVIRIFTAFHGTATALMLQLFVCQAAVEKTADDPCIDCLRSNATTGGFHGHIHYLADATTFPGQFCEQEINIQTLLPWTDPSTELATLHFRQPLLSFLNIPLVTPPSALFATSKLGHPLAVDCLRCHGLKPSDLQNFAWIAWPQSTNNTPTLSPNPAGRST